MMSTPRCSAPVVAAANPAAVRQALAFLGATPFDWAYLGEDFARDRAVHKLIGASGNRMALTSFLSKAAWKLRQAYIDYIGQLSLRFASPRWWVSDTAEKNPEASRVFFLATQLEACRRLLAERSEGSPALLLVVESPALRQALLHNLRRWGYQARLFAPRAEGVRLLLRDIARVPAARVYVATRVLARILQARYRYRAHRAPALQRALRSGQPLVLVHTWVDQRSFDSQTGAYRDPDFRELAAYLRGRGKQVVTVPAILAAVPYGRTVGSMARAEEPFLVPHAYITPMDVLRRSLASVLPDVPGWRRFPPLEGLEISAIVQHDLWRGWVSSRRVEDLLYMDLARRWKKTGIHIERVIYTFENDTWERALCMGMRRWYPEARTVAFQSSRLPLLYTTNYLAPCEQDIAPVPDRIVTSGRYPSRVLVESGGYHPERVVEGGALRQRYLFQWLNEGKKRGDQRNQPPQVLVTPSIGLGESAELVWKTLEAFRGETGLLLVTIKCHPSTPYELIAQSLGNPELPPHFGVSRRPVGELLLHTDLLIYSGATTGLEAIALGVPILHVSSEHRINYDSVDFAEHLRPTAQTPGEVRLLTWSILNNWEQVTRERREEWLQAVRSMFTEVTEETFARFLE